MQAQIHLIGNLVIWYSTSLSLFIYCGFLFFYLIRQRRGCFDIPDKSWTQFVSVGEVCLVGYLFHFIPYFFMERTLFLHHYLPAFIYKTLLLAAVIEHIYRFILTKTYKGLAYCFVILVCIWLGYVVHTFYKFSVLNYGIKDLSEGDLVNLRWRDTWDFILHRKWPLHWYFMQD